MARICDITGLSKTFGNKVSHSNRKTKRSYLVNLHNVTLISDVLKRKFKMKIASRTLRTIDYKGGFDSYLLNTRSNKLSDKALKIKRIIKKNIDDTGGFESYLPNKRSINKITRKALKSKRMIKKESKKSMQAVS